MDSFKRACDLCSKNMMGLVKIFCYQILLALMLLLITLGLFMLRTVGWILLIPFFLAVIPLSTAFSYNCYYKIFICNEHISFGETIKYTLVSMKGKYLKYFLYSIMMVVMSAIMFVVTLPIIWVFLFGGSALLFIGVYFIQYMYTYLIVSLFFDKQNCFEIVKYYMRDILGISIVSVICSMVPVIGSIALWILGLVLPVKILLDIEA